MSGFERHGITHLSASSLNLWTALPSLWTLRYLCGFKEFMGPAASRGTAVEMGLLHFLRGGKDPVGTALENFDLNIQGELSEKIDEERARIPGMLEQCVGWTAPGELLASQIKVECWLDGIAIPIIGYVDFSFDKTDVDLKTTKAMPSKPKPEHVRQASIYRFARKKEGKLLYITEKKRAEFDIRDEMRDAAIEELSLTARSLDKYLGAFESVADAVQCLPADRDNFRWSDAAEKAYRTAASGQLSAGDLRFLAEHEAGTGFEALD